MIDELSSERMMLVQLAALRPADARTRRGANTKNANKKKSTLAKVSSGTRGP